MLSLISTSVGALGFGLLVDVIGRRWAFNLTCLITSVFGLLLVRASFLSPDSSHICRLPQSITTAQYVGYTSLHQLVWEATFPSMQQSRLNSFHKTAGSSSPFYRCGSPLALLPLPVSLLAPPQSTDVLQHSLHAILSSLAKLAALYPAIWVGDTRSSSLAV